MLNKIKVCLFFNELEYLLLVKMNVETLKSLFFCDDVQNTIIHCKKQNKVMVLNEIRMKINHVKIESTKHFLYWNKFLFFSS